MAINERKWINLQNGRRFCREDDGGVTYENAYQGASMTFQQEDWLAVVAGVARPDVAPETAAAIAAQLHVQPAPEPVAVAAESTLPPPLEPDLSGLADNPRVDSGDLTPGEG